MTAEVRVLGSVTLVRDDMVVPLPEKQRRLLGALVAAMGEVVSDDRLVDAVWPESPPASAKELLRVYVSQVRKALGVPAALVRRGRGYSLQPLEELRCDATLFERMIDAADTAYASGSPARAASLFSEALSLWQGPAYGEYAGEDFARAEAARLEELRVPGRERWLEARLQAGEEIVADALALVAQHPLRERPHQLAMLALYREGRQSEALEVYRTLRSRLAEALGLEPGLDTRELEKRILRHDRTLLPSVAVAPVWPQPPASVNRLIGREREVDEVRTLLSEPDVRLITLSGAGGSGKTRLALEVARQAASDFAAGAAFVSLAAVHEPALLATAVADALAIDDTSTPDPWRAVAVALHEQDLLLVLDNVEQLHAAAPALVQLLAAAPRLKLLVTSRVVLHLTGEYVYPVEPLMLDAAVELFGERVRAAGRRQFAAAERRSEVEEICTRLDGLPLAIELAASRAATLTPSVLVSQLEHRLEPRGVGLRDLPARQQTLRATLEWSYRLLADSEQALFRRIAVFAEPPTLAAIEVVCDSTADVVATLVDHSLLSCHTEEPPRFGMLETVREFALGRFLGDPVESGEVRDRHADYVAGELEAVGPTRPSALGSADTRVALDWVISRGDPRLPRMVVALGRHWHAQGQLREASTWLEAAIGMAADVEVRAELLALAASLYLEGAQLERAGEALAEATSLSRRADCTGLEAWLVAITADHAAASGADPAANIADCERAADLLRDVGDRSRLADVLVTLGKQRLWCGKHPEDREALAEALEVARQSGNRAAELLALQWLAVSFVDLRAPTDVAIAEQERLLSLAHGAPRAEAGILMPLGWSYGYAGRFDDARRTITRAIEISKALECFSEARAGAMIAGSIELLAGSPTAAEEVLRRGLDEPATASEDGYRAGITICLAEAAHQRGSYPEAVQYARTARDIGLPAVEEAWTLSIEAKAEAGRGATDQAADLLQQAGIRATANSTRVAPWLQGELLFAQGEIEQVAGNHRAATAAFRAAHALYTERRAWPLAERAARLLRGLAQTPS